MPEMSSRPPLRRPAVLLLCCFSLSVGLIDPFWNRSVPSRGRTLRAVPRGGVPHLPAQPHVGEPHPHLQERGTRREEIPLLRPEDRWARLPR